MICLKLATRTSSFQVEVDTAPPNRDVANINYERKPHAVPSKRNTGTNYADSRYQLPQIDISGCFEENTSLRLYPTRLILGTPFGTGSRSLVGRSWRY